MENAELQVDVATYQKTVERELETLRRENFSLKLLLEQMKTNMENASKDVEKTKSPGDGNAEYA